MPGTLLEMIQFLDKNNIEIQPIREGKVFRFVIWRDGKVLKEGTHKYKNQTQGEWEVYSKICNALRMI